MLGNFLCVLSSADFLSKSSFSKNSFRNTARVVFEHLVEPDPVLNCLQRLSADDTSKQRVKIGVVLGMMNWETK